MHTIAKAWELHEFPFSISMKEMMNKYRQTHDRLQITANAGLHPFECKKHLKHKKCRGTKVNRHVPADANYQL